jgi:hypothetical protein
MFSQDEYQGTFGPSPAINFDLEATTESLTHQWPHHTLAPPVRGFPLIAVMIHVD